MKPGARGSTWPTASVPAWGPSSRGTGGIWTPSGSEREWRERETGDLFANREKSKRCCVKLKCSHPSWGQMKNFEYQFCSIFEDQQFLFQAQFHLCTILRVKLNFQRLPFKDLSFYVNFLIFNTRALFSFYYSYHYKCACKFSWTFFILFKSYNNFPKALIIFVLALIFLFAYYLPHYVIWFKYNTWFSHLNT